MSKDIFHWVYVSRASERFDDQALEMLLRRARSRNARRGITGLLMYADNRFMQILEGSRENIETLSEIIVKDDRHHDVDTLRFEYKSHRDFADWQMGYVRPENARYLRGFIPLLEKPRASHAALKGRSESYFFINAFLPSLFDNAASC